MKGVNLESPLRIEALDFEKSVCAVVFRNSGYEKHRHAFN